MRPGFERQNYQHDSGFNEYTPVSTDQGYEAVLLHVPWTRVETEREAAVAELPVRHGARPRPTEGMDQDLGNRVPDRQARLFVEKDSVSILTRS